MKRALVCGSAGFIGGHMVRRLKDEGYYVRGLDVAMPQWPIPTDDFYRVDLSFMSETDPLFTGRGDGGPFDEVYQFAANMGGMGFLGDSQNDAKVLRDNALINLHVLDACRAMGNKPRVFFASSACVYPGASYASAEYDAYPAEPELEYGWEKLFSERLYASYGHRGYIEPRVARYHNVFGPLGTWRGGREKAPAAICRKVAEALPNGTIEVWGTGSQTRSFLYVDEAIEATRRLMQSDFEGPLNIGSSESVSINDLVHTVGLIAGKKLAVRHVDGPVGVDGRNSDNTLIKDKLGWAPSQPLVYGLRKTYDWIAEQVRLTTAAA